MIARAGGYSGTEFQGARGVTQGDPLSTTIFNVVVDAVVRHWVMVMVEGAEEQGEREQEGRHQAASFYAYDGMVSSSEPRWLPGAFNTLVGLLGSVGLQNNVGNKVGMVCCPFQVAGNQSEAAYRRRIMGEGPTYREQQKGQVQCRECGEDVVEGYVAGHQMTQHGRAAEVRRSWKISTTGENPWTYRMAFPFKGGPRRYPVEGFPG